MTASELFALANNHKCEGKYECHWCTAPCNQRYLHDDKPIVVGVKRTSTAKRPANHWICEGCRLWRRKRTTITFLNGQQKDSQQSSNYSYWIANPVCIALIPNESGEFYKTLIKPPKKFVLSLTTPGKINQLHLAHVNENEIIKGDTPLFFTLDETKFQYTVYELEEALKNGTQGKLAGVRELIKFIGPLPIKLPVDEVHKKEVEQDAAKLIASWDGHEPPNNEPIRMEENGKKKVGRPQLTIPNSPKKVISR